MIILITDFTDDLKDVKNCITIFNLKFEEQIEITDDQSIKILNHDNLTKLVLEFFKELSPKIVFIGLGGVGKTTITKLIRAEDIPMQHIPTVVGNIVGIKIGNLTFSGWDLAGQEQFSFTWNKFIKKSDIIIIVIDSSQEISKIKRNRYFVDLIKRESPESKVIAIANKQDLPHKKSPEIIGKLLNVPTFPLIAINEDQRVNMLSYIAEILELSEEIQALIEPMVLRDDLIQLAELTLELTGNLNKVPKIYEQIAILSNELGEKDIAEYFMSKSKSISESINEYVKNLIENKKKSSKDLIELIHPDEKNIDEQNKQINEMSNKIVEIDSEIKELKEKINNAKNKKNSKIILQLNSKLKSLEELKRDLQEKIIELRFNKIQYLIT
ncbi:MAG: ADP-ribosylation factor-like protein [Candidatus Helarchaeota archaeon]